MKITTDSYGLRTKTYEFGSSELENILESYLKTSKDGFTQPCPDIAEKRELEIFEESYDFDGERDVPARITLTYHYKQRIHDAGKE